MKHLFLPYELALIAKEKGFNEKCLANWYSFKITKTKWSKPEFFISGVDNLNDREEELNKTAYHNLSAPLYQQIIDWFREKHNIEICTQVEFHSTPQSFGCCLHVKDNDDKTGYWTYHDSYYEALNKAIEEALRLI